MKSEAHALHIARRREVSDRILHSPEEFMVCSQCLSIAWKRASVCPICKAYRFCTSPDAVCVVAEVMKGFASPVSAGVVPRFEAVPSACKETERKKPKHGNYN